MKFHIFWIFALFVLCTSCSEFLEPKSENEFVPQTTSSLDEMLLYEVYNKGRNKPIFPYFTLLSDDSAVVPFSSIESDLIGAVHLSSIRALFSWQPDAYQTLDEDRVSEDSYDIYSACYVCILGCNATLDYLSKVDGEELEKRRIEAEARALRAFYYFHLVNCYGLPYNYDKKSLGVPLHLHSSVSSSFIARNTVEEVYDQILIDLKRAQEIYQSLASNKQGRANMRVSLPFVPLLLSRVFLYMEEWELAAEFAQMVLEDTRFRLIDHSELPQTEGESYFNFHSYNNPETIWVYGSSYYLNDFENPYMIVSGGSKAFVIASSDLLYSYEIGDIRRTQYLVRDRNSTNYRAYGKFAINKNNLEPDPNGYFARSFRLAEAYLNGAEAEAMLFKNGEGNEHKEKAIQLVEILRSKRIVSPDPDEMDYRTPERLVNSIRAERRRELCFEDHRWFDLRRYGMPSLIHVWFEDANGNQRTAYTLKEKDPSYTLQIPTTAMLMNKALVQNPAGPVRID